MPPVSRSRVQVDRKASAGARVVDGLRRFSDEVLAPFDAYLIGLTLFFCSLLVVKGLLTLYYAWSPV